MDLNNLLPKNNTPTHPTSEKSVFDAAANEPKTKAETSKKDVTGSLDARTKASSVFMLYRIVNNEKLAMMSTEYLDHFCTLADNERGCLSKNF